MAQTHRDISRRGFPNYICTFFFFRLTATFVEKLCSVSSNGDIDLKRNSVVSRRIWYSILWPIEKTTWAITRLLVSVRKRSRERHNSQRWYLKVGKNMPYIHLPLLKY